MLYGYLIIGGVPQFLNLANLSKIIIYILLRGGGGGGGVQQTALIIVTTKIIDKLHTNENYTHFAIGKFIK